MSPSSLCRLTCRRVATQTEVGDIVVDNDLVGAACRSDFVVDKVRKCEHALRYRTIITTVLHGDELISFHRYIAAASIIICSYKLQLRNRARSFHNHSSL